MILLLITIIPRITHKDNIITLLLITIMPQIIYKELISFYFPSILLSSVNVSQESCVCTVENMSTPGVYLFIIKYHFQEDSKLDTLPNYNCSL